MNFIRLATFASLLQVVNLGMPVIYAFLILKIYGITIFGAYATIFSSIAVLIAVAEFGMNTYGIANIGNKNDKRLSKNLFIAITQSKILLFVATLPIYFLIIHFISVPTLNFWGQLSGVIYLFGCAINSTWFAYHAEKVKEILYCTLLIRMAAILALLIMPMVDEGVNFPIFINSISVLIIGGLSLFNSLNILKIYGECKVAKSNLKSFFSTAVIPARHLAMTSIFVVVYTSVTVVIVSQVLGSTAAGLIGFAERIIRAIQSVLSGISTAALAKSESMTFSKNNFITKSQIYLYIFFGLILFSVANFILGFFDRLQSIEAEIVLKIYAYILVAGGISSVLGLSFFVRNHKYKLQAYTTLIGALLSPPLILVASRTYGVIGAAYASAIVETVILFFSIYLIMREPLK